MKTIIIVLLFIGTTFTAIGQTVKAFNIDYNWDPGGGYINNFAAPGLWADADPAELMQWYEDLGCNAVHSFAVSCNGYSWYKNGVIAEQPGLKHDFLTEMVRIGRKKNIKVFGYYCVGANTKWGLDHPDLSYGTPSAPHIPFTNAYLDYLCASVKDAIIKTDMDGIMLDWIWTPAGYKEPYKPVKWLECEKEMYRELMGKSFPGAENVSRQEEAIFRAKSIARCWDRIYEAVKSTKPNCLIWITCNNIKSPDVAYSKMFRQTDWLMNEAGDVESTEAMMKMVRKETVLITCLAEWNGQDPVKVAKEAVKSGVSLYGFTKPIVGYMMPPVYMYQNHPIDTFRGDNRNLSVLVRAFKGLPIENR